MTNLDKIMKAKRVRNVDLSTATGIEADSIRYWRRGKLTTCTKAVLIADTLGVTLDELLREET